ncbi:MgtC/SapB family protein [Natrialbaceae archaeon AArc-T1-2]|uniref:MgtC/SapB family protein n=1 Tax=Natrialbaceae archaeon AArc-T1-2 TaxID=3053904 RepID=UPI00255A79A1|nr:MgtC/SapB family protein [Natrialbaceae archaeon AArc-T1-2]WIV66001.1 MgtC/SapB family protein [Natrialbaceae archaeon AArc-T1-2]
MDVADPVALFVALGIGALIGLEREQSESAGSFAGVRTFPLVALLGGVVQLFFPDLLGVVLALYLVLVAIGYASKVVLEGDIGMSTAVAAVLTFVYGAMATHSGDGLVLSVVFGTVTAALLAIKEPAHAFADRIGRDDLRDALTFLILALVVLPLLPDEELDVLLGLNPRFVWLMVVFVSGLSFLGYVLTKVLGPEKGIGLTGLFGGFVSSTATVMAMAEQARHNPELTPVASVAAAIASITMFPRALILVAVVNPSLALSLAVPLLAMTAVGVVLAAFVIRRLRADGTPTVDLENPFRLGPALAFGAFFAVILVLLETLNPIFGEAGVYGTAIVSGLADVNAITLSLGRLALEDEISRSVAETGVVLAVVINSIVKMGIARIGGSAEMGRLVMGVLGTSALVGVVIVVLR